MKRKIKFYGALALIAAFSLAATGCDKEKDSSSAEATQTVSINVIGEDIDRGAYFDPDSDLDLDGNSGSRVSAESSDSAAVSAEETVILTDENGDPVLGLGGSVITMPKETTAGTYRTLSESEIQDAMTAVSTDANLNISGGSTEKYGYSTLSAEEKKLYDDIVSGAEKLRYKICDTDAYTIEEWTKIYGMVYNQEPQLFYMNSKSKVGKIFYNTRNADAINQMQKDIDAVADKLVAEAAGKSSTFDKLKVFHDYLVLNSSFELLEDNMNYNSSIYNAFGSGNSQGNIQCSGYAKAMKYLCDKAGIKCMVITGENMKGRSHAWNIVDVDGKWYNLDATWDDPIIDPPNYKNIKYSYFLVPDKWIHDVTHTHVNQLKLSSGKYITYFTPPACTETKQNYFIKKGLVYSDFETAETAIKAEIKKSAESGVRTAQIMVSSKEIYDKLFKNGIEYQKYAREFPGVRGLNNSACVESMLIIEFDVLYN